MFKAKLIDKKEYYSLRSKQALLLLLPSIPMALLINFVELQWYLVVLALVIYILSFYVILYHTPESKSALMIIMAVIGAAGSSMTVCFICVKEHNQPRFSSTAVGLMNMFVVGSGAVMQPLIGWLLDLNWGGELVDGARVYDTASYTFALSSLLVVNLAAFFGVLLLRETHCKQLKL